MPLRIDVAAPIVKVTLEQIPLDLVQPSKLDERVAALALQLSFSNDKEAHRLNHRTLIMLGDFRRLGIRCIPKEPIERTRSPLSPIGMGAALLDAISVTCENAAPDDVQSIMNLNWLAKQPRDLRDTVWLRNITPAADVADDDIPYGLDSASDFNVFVSKIRINTDNKAVTQFKEGSDGSDKSHEFWGQLIDYWLERAPWSGDPRKKDKEIWIIDLNSWKNSAKRQKRV
eukprot:5321954-Amphidinium_carterae.1